MMHYSQVFNKDYYKGSHLNGLSIEIFFMAMLFTSYYKNTVYQAREIDKIE